LRVVLTWGTCAVLLFLVASPAFSDGPSWTQVPFLLCAAGLVAMAVKLFEREAILTRWK